MRVSLVTVGSRGDVEPFVALALALRGLGAEATVAAPADTRGLVEGFGVPYAPLSAEFLTMAQTDEGRRAVAGDPRAGVRLLGEVRRGTARLLREVQAAAEDADRLVFHPKALAGRHLAEAWRVPAWVATAVPLLVPTRAFPAPATVGRDLGPLNRATYALASAAEGMFAREVGAWRAELGLPPKARRGVRSAGERTLPVLHAHSRHLVPTPPDWDEGCLVTGAWRVPTDRLPTLAPEVAAFLAAGPPPVVVGFGSMGVEDPDALARLAAAAVRAVGRRGVLVGLPTVPGDDVLSVASAPFGRLFPRSAATVHHGGAGTTAASLLAGVPTVVVPHGMDQPFWADRVVAAGVGARTSLEGLNAGRLAGTLASALDPSVVGRARRIGALMGTEGGAERAASVVLAG